MRRRYPTAGKARTPRSGTGRRKRTAPSGTSPAAEFTREGAARKGPAHTLAPRFAAYLTPTLFAALDALPWADTPITHREVDKSHGRVTTRTIQVRPAPPDLPFPHATRYG